MKPLFGKILAVCVVIGIVWNCGSYLVKEFQKMNNSYFFIMGMGKRECERVLYGDGFLSSILFKDSESVCGGEAAASTVEPPFLKQ